MKATADDRERGILFASDGSPAARNAGPVAGLIATQCHLSGLVVSVLPEQTSPAPDAKFSEGNRSLALARDADVIGDTTSDWHHTMAVGHAATEIVRASEAHHAQMIVMGLRPHDVVDRLFRDETALVVMQRSKIPVLGVALSARSLPETVVVGIDFSRASIAALNTAAAIIRPGGTLLLAHVSPHSLSRRGTPATLCTLYNDSVSDSLVRLQKHVESTWDLRVEAVVLSGAVVPELRMLSHARGINMLAVGKSSDLQTSVSLGSVPTALTRVAECSLLVAPGEFLSRAH